MNLAERLTQKLKGKLLDRSSNTASNIIQLSAIETSDIMIYTGETSDIRRGEAESDIILARLYKS